MRRRWQEKSHLLRPVAAAALGVVLTLGGVWLSQAQQDGHGAPYGSAISLTKSLEDGDCVIADWPGARFKGTPQLIRVPCLGGQPDGQVMAVVEAATASEARSEGPEQCEQRTQEILEKLADVRDYAVVPTAAGFEAADRRTACLVLGAHGPVYGPLDRHRTTGMAFVNTANMQQGDCLDVVSSANARLVSCAGPHQQKILGFARLGADVTFTEARDESQAACERDVPPLNYGFDPATYGASAWVSESSWASGTRVVVCTVQRQDGHTMSGDES